MLILSPDHTCRGVGRCRARFDDLDGCCLDASREWNIPASRFRQSSHNTHRHHSAGYFWIVRTDAFGDRRIAVGCDSSILADRFSGLPHPRGYVPRLLDSRRHARALRRCRRESAMSPQACLAARGRLGCTSGFSRSAARESASGGTCSGMIDFAVAINRWECLHVTRPGAFAGP